MKEFEVWNYGGKPLIKGNLTEAEYQRVLEVLNNFGWNDGQVDITDGPVLYPSRGEIEEGMVRLFDDEKGIEVFEAPNGYWDWEVIKK